MTNITSSSWISKVEDPREAALRRIEAIRAGRPVFSNALDLSRTASFVAKRNGVCQICNEATAKGDTLRAVGGRRYAHWECVQKAQDERRGPSAVVGGFQRHSLRTELRRRVFWAVECPTCGAGVNEGCLKENGLRRTRNHARRVSAYSLLKRKKAVVANHGVLQELREVTQRFRDFLTPVVVDEDDVDVCWDAEIEWASLRL